MTALDFGPETPLLAPVRPENPPLVLPAPVTPSGFYDPTLVSPYKFFGGKRKVAQRIWRRFGNVPNYCEGFLGSGAVLLARPHPPQTETVCDADGLICNVWRSLQHAPEAVAEHANYPVHESDLHARHLWLCRNRESLTERLMADPFFHDPRAAGWWLWGAEMWIGTGWCSGDGAWTEVDGVLVRKNEAPEGEPTVHRKMPTLSGNNPGVARQIPTLSGGPIERDRMPHFRRIQTRIRHVRTVSGNWDRILGPSVTTGHGLTAVYLDPPYADAEHSVQYAGGGNVWLQVVAWCRENGNNPLLRIALSGYDDGNVDLPGWDAETWTANGGYGNQGEGRGRENAEREKIWFSPHCEKLGGLFAGADWDD